MQPDGKNAVKQGLEHHDGRFLRQILQQIRGQSANGIRRQLSRVKSRESTRSESKGYRSDESVATQQLHLLSQRLFNSHLRETIAPILRQRMVRRHQRANVVVIRDERRFHEMHAELIPYLSITIKPSTRPKDGFPRESLGTPLRARKCP